MSQAPNAIGSSPADGAIPVRPSEGFDHHRGARPLLHETGKVRGIVFVGVTLGMFGLANAFLYFLGTGRWLDFSAASYRHAVGATLADLLLAPLSIFSYPWMIFVAGLLMAAVVFVPVMVAVLYRLWVSFVFIAVVAVVGHAPLLAAFLAGGALLAAKTPLRSNLPFLAALLGLLPLLGYFGFFCLRTERLLTPIQRLVLYLPPTLALLAAIIGAAIVPALAKLTRYRPGVVWPVLLVCLAAPMALFFQKIGTAEMAYAVLAYRANGGDAIFPPENLSEFRRRCLATMPSRKDPGIILGAARFDLDARRAGIIADCDRFLARYGGTGPSAQGASSGLPNPRCPAVFWIKAAIMDVQVDPSGIPNRLVKYCSAGPTEQSMSLWAELAERYPDSPQAIVARHRLALRALRDGRIAAGLEHLAKAQALIKATGQAVAKAPDAPEGIWERLFRPAESLPGEEYCREVMADCARLAWLIQENKVVGGGDRNQAAFAEWMQLWPLRDLAPLMLGNLAGACPETELQDNYHLLLAMAEKDDLERAGKLSVLAEKLDDSAIIANYELGRLAMRLESSPGWVERGLKPAEFYFSVVCGARDNPYKAPAQQHLVLRKGRKEAKP